MYKADRAYKTIQLISYKLGVIPNTSVDEVVLAEFKGVEKEDVLEKIMKHHKVTDVTLNAMGSPGCVSFEVLENEKGRPAKKKEKELWEQGKMNLYKVQYTYYICKIVREWL